MQVIFDASDYARVAKIYGSMPAKMQNIAFARAAARARGVVERDYARFASRTLKIAQKLVKARMRTRLSGADIILDVKSTNIPLHEMGPTQQAYGVFVPQRGRYEHAWIGKGNAAGIVLMRKGAARYKTTMLFGPSPANAINRKPGEYEDILAEIAAGEFAKTILQQAAYLMGSAG